MPHSSLLLPTSGTSFATTPTPQSTVSPMKCLPTLLAQVVSLWTVRDLFLPPNPVTNGVPKHLGKRIKLSPQLSMVLIKNLIRLKRLLSAPQACTRYRIKFMWIAAPGPIQLRAGVRQQTPLYRSR